jgi:spoIIIJ-associated protein
MPNNPEVIKNKIVELLSTMGVDSSVYERQEEGRTVFNIKTPDAQLLIGKQGANLEALQHVIRLLVRKEFPAAEFPFAIDIDDYKDKRTIYLKELARKAAHEVRRNGKPLSLAPMPAHERRVVHNYLSLFSDISSGSVGTEPNRKIIIKPKAKDKNSPDFTFIENL